jgi:2-polyprenyl-6-methoxyphenol hydroxylase-like FAD-dependent oxidoreductase
MARLDTDVLVVGAGPTGLTLGCDLSRRGIACRIIDRAPAFHQKSRGKGIQPRSLEILADLGAVEPVLTAGWARNFRVRWHVNQKLLTELRLPGRDPRPDVPYPNLVLLPQWQTEHALRDRLAAFGGKVELGCELESFVQDEHGVTATVRDVASGSGRQLRSRYLIGCDGGHSRVRDTLGLVLTGDTHQERFVFGDMEVDGLDSAAAYVWFEGDAYLAASPFPSQRAWQIQASIRPDEQGQLQPASLELFQHLVRERTGRVDVQLSNASWLSNFVSNVRMVDRYRVGRVFLAGDAAHVHSPAGGQGMNTGIQDAYNLGWKLGLVLRGQSAESLLDTYEEERLPIAQAVLKGTDVGYQAVFSSNPVVTVLRERALLPLLRVPRLQQAILSASDQLDLNYRGASLAKERRSAGPRVVGRLHELRTVLSSVDWYRVMTSPRAGDRAPDAELHDLRTGAQIRLFDLLRGPHFTLVLFDSPTASHDEHQEMEATADRIERLYGSDVHACLVLSRTDRSDQLSSDRVAAADPTHQAHRTYGAGGGGMCLIRPDGYVAMRARSLSDVALDKYLSRILICRGGRSSSDCDS